MKIFILPVDRRFQPDHQNYIWPPQNKLPGMDFGVEQDFLNWISKQDKLLVKDISKADWLYLPVFFNRYYINTPDADGHWGGGVDELNAEIARNLNLGKRIFTISEADEFILHKQIEWGDLIMFTASRRGDKGIDIPLLSAPHKMPAHLPKKKWIASFMGNLATDGIRIDMKNLLKNRDDCYIEHATNPIDQFVNLMLESHVALCPRGQGAQSFRMYEAMSLGTIPLYISDIDCRPFKKWINWDNCSFYLRDLRNLNSLLDEICFGYDLDKMSTETKKTYNEQLNYGKWCKYVIKELEGL